MLAMVDREFICARSFPADMATKLCDAFKETQKSGYSEFVAVSTERAREILDNAAGFVKTVKTALSRLPTQS